MPPAEPGEELMAILSAFGVSGVVSATPVSGGADTAIWRVDAEGAEYALRLFRPDQVNAAGRESAAMRVARESGLPVPRVHSSGVWNGRPALLIDWTPGQPLRHEQLTEVLDEMKGRLQPGDKVYLYYGGVPAFTFYTRHDPFPAAVVIGNEYRKRRTGYLDELRKLAGEPRVWLVFSHRHNAEESLVLAYAESLGTRLDEIHREGATAFLFDFRR